MVKVRGVSARLAPLLISHLHNAVIGQLPQHGAQLW